MPTENAQLHVDDPEYGDLVFDAVVAGADDGEPVLLLHGWPQTAWSWRRVIGPLAAAGLRVAAVDQRGYSEGARPADVDAYANVHLAEDAAGILDALGWGTAHVVGHDWGAVVAWHLAGTSPGLVRSLTALSVPHPAALVAAIASDPAQAARSAYLAGFQRDPAGSARALLADDAVALRGVYAGGVHADDVEEYVAFFAEADGAALEAALRWYAAMRSPASRPTPEVDVATTFVWGTDDIAIGETAALACGQYVHGPYEFRRLGGRGHWLPDEDPPAVVDAVLHRVGQS